VPTQEDIDTCPLVSRHTSEWGINPVTLAKLHWLRELDLPSEEGVPFKWPSKLRPTIWSALKGCDTGDALIPKQYQLVMAHHLGRMPRFIDGDSVGLGKTLEAIIAATWLADRVPKLKLIVFTTKSCTGQWAEEIERFSLLRPHIMQDKYKKLKSYEARFAQLRDFLTNDDHDVLLCKYTSMIGKRRKVEGKFDEDGYPTFNGRERVSREIKQFLAILKPHAKDVLMVCDECQKFKTIGSQTRGMIQILSRPCARVWALTATVIKNGIDEFYSIAAAIGIQPLGSYKEFEEDFCIHRDVTFSNGRTDRVLVGYKNVEKFKAALRPWFLGRSQRQVKEKLPRLMTVMHALDLSEEQKQLLLHDIPSGAFELPPSIIKQHGEIVLKDRDPENEMTMLSVYQLVANHPALLDPSDKKAFLTYSLSPKEEALLDMLDGDLRGEKVIVYTKSRTWIDRLEYLTEEGRFTERKFLRITGAESETARIKNKQLFQDPDSGYDLIMINAAATEGVNLQSAAHMIALDPPWSFGDLLQLVGRMLRLASIHSLCTLHVFAAKGTVDEYAIEVLRTKKGVFEKILGESHSAGLLDDRDVFDLESGMEQVDDPRKFLDMMKAHVKGVSLRSFTKGQQLAAAALDENYVPAFDKKAKPRKERPPLDEDFDEQVNKWGF
jgi:SNF2 family DNA or RNA helicase